MKKPRFQLPITFREPEDSEITRRRTLALESELKGLRSRLQALEQKRGLEDVARVRFDEIDRRLRQDDETFKSHRTKLERLETMRTPNQQLIEGYQQLIKKMTDLDIEKFALSQTVRDALDFLNHSPDWLFKEEAKLVPKDEPRAES